MVVILKHYTIIRLLKKVTKRKKEDALASL